MKNERTPHKLNHPGPYIAVVKNHLDPGYMGGLEVSLIRKNVDNTDIVANQSIKVQYLSPFYGITSIAHVTGTTDKEAQEFNRTQKSYGMWMVPPDIGTHVMVIFVEGSSNEGYWIGCVQDRYMNHMIPGLASSQDVMLESQLSPEQVIKYGKGITNLPVAEYNKKVSATLDMAYRPVHPFANRLAQQGLLADNIRGVTSSSARRELPSMVFGISTPGPLDKNNTDPASKGSFMYDGKSPEKPVPVSRLGGSQFVMDDGDKDGDNELIRLRTRTGHQILLHNTKDLIYIANAGGTAWIELTSNGKIDIFAQDSVSIHSEVDFNLRAGRDFNIEAGRNINMHAFSNMTVDVKGDLSMIIKNSAKVTAVGKLFINSSGDINIASDTNTLMSGKSEVNITSENAKISGSNEINLSGATANLSASGKVNIKGGSGIVQNQGAVPATVATPATTTKATNLSLYKAPFTQAGAGWENNVFFSAGTISTILQRVPTHEPWTQHEDMNAAAYSADNTDNTSSTVNSAYTEGADSIAFGSGSGDAAHFAQTQPALQTAVQKAADKYKQLTGKPLIISSSFRSKAEQLALYNRWIEAGGGPNTPKAAGIFTPVDPNSKSWPNAHARGIGFDSPSAPELDKLGILAENGLFRPVPGTDPVHVALRSAPAAPGKDE
jgi:uncharacterized protein (DUF2345 family)